MPRKKALVNATPTAPPLEAWALEAADGTDTVRATRVDGLIVDVRAGGATLTLKSPLGHIEPLTLKDIAGLEVWLGPIRPSQSPLGVPTPCFYIPAKYYTSAAELRSKIDQLMPAPLRVWVAGRAWEA